ncbi:MAG: hypothetical protein ACFBSC_13020 [Microcoleaceae cyanobacterium]
MRNHTRKFSTLLVAFAATAGTSAFLAPTLPAVAGDGDLQPFAEEFIDAATGTSGDAFDAQSILGQMSTIFGLAFPWPGNINAFPETLIVDDAQAFNKLYREAMIKQTSSDPVIRTPDLINPFNTSILSQPYGNPNAPVPTPFQ